MVIKRPKGFYLLGKGWDIRFCKMKRLHGHCSDPPPIIQIDTGQSPDDQRDALAHEMTHAMDFDLSIGLTETQVGQVATAWLQTMRLNPKIVAFLLAK